MEDLDIVEGATLAVCIPIIVVTAAALGAITSVAVLVDVLGFGRENP